MTADYGGYDSADLARHITSLMTERTGRIWDGRDTERLSVWLADSANRAVAVEWLVYVGETEDHLLDPMDEFARRKLMDEFALRKPMVEVLTGGRHEHATGFVARPRRWWFHRQ